MELMSIEDKFQNLILQYNRLLPRDEEGLPIYPKEEEGQGYVYTKKNINKFHMEFNLALINLQKLFVRFQLSSTKLFQTWIRTYTRIECLGDKEIYEAFV